MNCPFCLINNKICASTNKHGNSFSGRTTLNKNHVIVANLTFLNMSC